MLRFAKIGSDWPRFAQSDQFGSDQLRWLGLAQICQNLPSLVQIVQIGSDRPRFAQIGPDWLRLALIGFHLVRLPQIGLDLFRFKLIRICSDWLRLA